MNELYGIKFIGCIDLVKRIQFRFPKSKKKRIRNKWSKRPENYKHIPWETFMYNELNNTYYAHPSMIEELIKDLDNSNKEC